MGTLPRPGHAAKLAKAAPHGHATKAKACNKGQDTQHWGLNLRMERGNSLDEMGGWKRGEGRIEATQG